MMTKEKYNAIASAVHKAVEAVGIEGLKMTSMFPSSAKKHAKKQPQYWDGFYAKNNGVALEANPYDIHTQPWSNMEWQNGWYDCLKDIEKDKTQK